MRGPRDGDAVLLRMLGGSLRQGHWRVACRRYLMLLARDCTVPGAWRDQCEVLLARCAPAQRASMQADAQRWAAMVRDEAPAPLAPESNGAMNPLVVRTVWRPLPACFRATAPAG
jgi:hypothetical protein